MYKEKHLGYRNKIDANGKGGGGKNKISPYHFTISDSYTVREKQVSGALI